VANKQEERITMVIEGPRSKKGKVLRGNNKQEVRCNKMQQKAQTSKN